MESWRWWSYNNQIIIGSHSWSEHIMASKFSDPTGSRDDVSCQLLWSSFYFINCWIKLSAYIIILSHPWKKIFNLIIPTYYCFDNIFLFTIQSFSFNMWCFRVIMCCWTLAFDAVGISFFNRIFSNKNILFYIDLAG